jgi:hypothetical protein
VTYAAEDVLERTRSLLGLRSLVLRPSAGVPHQFRPADRGCVLDVPVWVHGVVLGVLTATSASPFTEDDAGLLAALAHLLARTLSDDAVSPAAMGQQILDAEADRAQTAADLDGVVEAVVALGHVDAAALPEAVGAALGQIRTMQRELRALSLESGLRAALNKLDAEVDADDAALDTLAPPVAVALQRIAETVTRAATGPVRISAKVSGTTVKFCAESADNGRDAFELSRWSRRVSALGGELRQQHEGVEVHLPAGPATKDDRDDSPHL